MTRNLRVALGVLGIALIAGLVGLLLDLRSQGQQPLVGSETWLGENEASRQADSGPDKKPPKPKSENSSSQDPSRPIEKHLAPGKDRGISEEVFQEVAGFFERVALQACPKRRLPRDWSEILRNNLQWNEDLACWDAMHFQVEWPVILLKSFGGPRKSGMPEKVHLDNLEAWMKAQVESGGAIPLESAIAIAEEFAKRFVPDWNQRHYQIVSSRWETSRPSLGGSGDVDDVRYIVEFVQTPLLEAGEIVVTEAPILIWVDPWTSEVVWFIRNPVGESRIEPRIAFCGPLVAEASARDIWERRLETEIGGVRPTWKLMGRTTFKLKVEVSWDEHDIATGRPLWVIDFGLGQATYEVEDEAPAFDRPSRFGCMKVDARSGEIVDFQIQ